MAKQITKFTFIKTENNIFILYNGQRFEISRANSMTDFVEIKQMLIDRDEDAVLRKLLKGDAYVIPEFSNGLFKVDFEQEKVIDIETGTEVGMELSRRIVDWAKEGLPFEPLLKFHRKVINNPNKESAADLYTFLERNKIPINNDGRFVAYKRVHRLPDGNLVDVYTKTISHNLGDKPRMERENCDADRTVTCSYGLHVCGFSYLSSYSGEVVIEVLVDPVDVVAVPEDYNGSKMRTCGYEVIKVNNGKEMDDKFVSWTKEDVGDDDMDFPNFDDDDDDDMDFSNFDDDMDEDNKPTFQVSEISVADLMAMTAQNIKDYIFEKFRITININNKNKKQIIKKAKELLRLT